MFLLAGAPSAQTGLEIPFCSDRKEPGLHGAVISGPGQERNKMNLNVLSFQLARKLPETTRAPSGELRSQFR